MRYFLFTISTSGTYETVAYESPYFPKRTELQEHVGTTNCCLLNIFEFKSKEDYDSFTSKS